MRRRRGSRRVLPTFPTYRGCSETKLGCTAGFQRSTARGQLGLQPGARAGSSSPACVTLLPCSPRRPLAQSPQQPGCFPWRRRLLEGRLCSGVAGVPPTGPPWVIVLLGDSPGFPCATVACPSRHRALLCFLAHPFPQSSCS